MKKGLRNLRIALPDEVRPFVQPLVHVGHVLSCVDDHPHAPNYTESGNDLRKNDYGDFGY